MAEVAIAVEARTIAADEGVVEVIKVAVEATRGAASAVRIIVAEAAAVTAVVVIETSDPSLPVRNRRLEESSS